MNVRLGSEADVLSVDLRRLLLGGKADLRMRVTRSGLFGYHQARLTDGDRNPGRMTGGQSGMGGKADLSQLRRPILRSQAKKDHLSQVRRAI